MNKHFSKEGIQIIKHVPTPYWAAPDVLTSTRLGCTRGSLLPTHSPKGKKENKGSNCLLPQGSTTFPHGWLWRWDPSQRICLLAGGPQISQGAVTPHLPPQGVLGWDGWQAFSNDGNTDDDGRREEMSWPSSLLLSQTFLTSAWDTRGTALASAANWIYEQRWGSGRVAPTTSSQAHYSLSRLCESIYRVRVPLNMDLIHLSSPTVPGTGPST